MLVAMLFLLTFMKVLMTDEVQPSSNAESKKNNQPLGSQSDWFLQKLVNYANDFGLEFGITLQVSGMLVSGTIIGGKKYFDEFSASFTSELHEQAIADAFSDLFNSYKRVYEVSSEERDSLPPPEYVHIKNARFYQPGQKGMPTDTALLWRGRLREVGGFSLGSFSES